MFAGRPAFRREVSWPSAGFPGVIVRSEVRALRDRGMAVGPEDKERVRVGLVQRSLAEDLEGANAGLLRIGDDSVNGFLAVDVGLVFDGAAESICHRFGYKFESEKNQG